MNKIVFVLLFIFLSNQVNSQNRADSEKDYSAKENDWHFIVTPYVWFSTQATTLGGEKMTQTFDDLMSNMNAGIQLGATVMYNNWLLTADGTYLNLGSDVDLDVIKADINIKHYILHLKLGYIVYSDFQKNENNRSVSGWQLEVNAGTKYWENRIGIDYKVYLGGTPIVEDELEIAQHWWDPMIGAEARVFITPKILMGLSANVGGFGIGNASKLSWDFIYYNVFRVSNLVAISVGYKQFKFDREDGEGEEKIDMSANTFGPFIGLSITF